MVFSGTSSTLLASCWRCNWNIISLGNINSRNRTLSSLARQRKASSTFMFSLAEVSITNRISGIYWHIWRASSKSTSRCSSKSHLLPTRIIKTLEAVYLRTSSIHFADWKRKTAWWCRKLSGGNTWYSSRVNKHPADKALRYSNQCQAITLKRSLVISSTYLAWQMDGRMPMPDETKDTHTGTHQLRPRWPSDNSSA